MTDDVVESSGITSITPHGRSIFCTYPFAEPMNLRVVFFKHSTAP